MQYLVSRRESIIQRLKEECINQHIIIQTEA